MKAPSQSEAQDGIETAILASLPEIADRELLLSVYYLYVDSLKGFGSYSRPIVPHIPIFLEHSEVKFDANRVQSLCNTKNIKELAAFLAKSAASDVPVPMYLVSKQLGYLSKCVGLKFLFAAHLRTISLMADTFLEPVDEAPNRTNMSYVQRAMNLLLDMKLPPLFYPDMLTPPYLTVPIGALSVRSPTAFCVTPNAFVVGTGEEMHNVSFNGNVIEKMKKQLVPQDEPYSIAVVDSLTLISAPSLPVSCLDWIDRSDSRIPVVWESGGAKTWSSLYPMISSGSRLMSIEFGAKPKVNVFSITGESAVFVCSVVLRSQLKLNMVGGDLLPMKQRDTASMSTNGVYLAVLLRGQNVTICRVFRLGDGQHVADINLGAGLDVKGWCFDPVRLSHCIIVGNVIIVLDSKVTIPTAVIGFNTSNGASRLSESKETFSKILSFIASLCICACSEVPFSVDDCDAASGIESVIYQLISNGDYERAKIFITFLPIRFRRNDYDLRMLVPMLKAFTMCFNASEYVSLRRLIAVTVVTYLDTFAKADAEQTSLLLKFIFEMNVLGGYILKCLNRCASLVNICTVGTLDGLCRLAFSPPMISATDALLLLEQIQDYLLESDCGLFTYYVGLLAKEFAAKLQDTVNIAEFETTTVFSAFEALLNMLRKSFDKLESNFQLVKVFFSTGCLSVEHISESVLEILNKSLIISFEMAFHLISHDRNLYTHNSCYIPNNGQTMELNWYSANPVLRDNLNVVIQKSLLVNITREQIQEQIDVLMHKIRMGGTSEAAVLSKCETINSIQPQLFESIMLSLSNDMPVSSREFHESCVLQFVDMFASIADDTKGRILATWSVFFQQLEENKQHFLMLSEEQMRLFVQFFEDSPYLPVEFLEAADVQFSDVKELSTTQLKECYSTLSRLSKQLQPFDVDFTLCEPKKSVILANLAVDCHLPISFDALYVFDNYIMSDDYDVVHFGMLLLRKRNTDHLFIQVVHKCVDFVGRFVNRTEHILLLEGDKTKLLIISMLICDHLRAIFTENSLDLGQWMRDDKQNLIVYLMMLAHDIDIMRPCAMCKVRHHDCLVSYGQIDVIQDGYLVLRHHDNSCEVIDIDECDAFEVSPLNRYDMSGVKNLRDLKENVMAYEPKYDYLEVFRLSALKCCLENSRFRELVTGEDVKILTPRFIETLDTVPELLKEFQYFFVYDIDELPLFFFVSDDNQDQRIMDYQREKPGTSCAGSVYSTRFHVKATSSPIHSSLRCSLRIAVHSTHQKTPLLVTIIQVGPMGGACFTTPDIAIPVDRDDCFIAMIPERHVILVQVCEEQQAFLLQPACDMVYIALKLAPETVVEYQFNTNLDNDPVLESTNRCIPKQSDVWVVELPCVMSASYWQGHVKDITERLLSCITEEILTEVPWSQDTRAKLLLHVMLRTDRDPLSHRLTIHEDRIRWILDKLRESMCPDERTNFLTEIIDQLTRKQKELSLDGKVGARGQALFHGTMLAPRTEKESYVLVNGALSRLCSNTMIEGENIIVFHPYDISHTVVGLVTDIRHSLSIALFLAPSNKALFRFIQQMADLSTSLELAHPVIKYLHTLLPDEGSEISGQCSFRYSIYSWLKETYCDYYLDNVDYITESISHVFLCQGGSRLFPLASLVHKLLLAIAEDSNPAKSVECPSEMCVFVMFDGDGPQEVEIALGKSGHSCVVPLRTPAIVCESFQVAESNTDGLHMKVAVFQGADYINQVIDEISSWKLNWSHQLILGAELLSREMFDLLPLSTAVDYGVGKLCLDIMRTDKLGVLQDHHLTSDFQVQRNVAGRASAYFRKFDPESVACKRPASDECLAAGLLGLAETGSVLEYTVERAFWEKLGDQNTNLNLVIRLLSCCGSSSISAVCLRKKCSNVTNVTASDLLDCIKWVAVPDTSRKAITDYLTSVPSIIRLYFIEWITGEWGHKALKHSDRSNILVLGTTQDNHLEAKPSERSLEVGTFSDPDHLFLVLKRGLQHFLDSQYK